MVRSLYHRATGYRFTSQQVIKVKEQLKPGTFKEKAVVVDVENVVPPDTTAGIFWLKNRRAADWRDKHEHEHSGEVTQKHEHVRTEIERELDKHAAEGKKGGVAGLTH